MYPGLVNLTGPTLLPSFVLYTSAPACEVKFIPFYIHLKPKIGPAILNICMQLFLMCPYLLCPSEERQDPSGQLQRQTRGMSPELKQLQALRCPQRSQGQSILMELRAICQNHLFSS